MKNFNPEQQWFRVFISNEAEMILPSNSKTEAFAEVIDYCNQNRFLELDPEMMLPHALWGIQLERPEAEMYSKIQQKTNVQPIRLIQLNRSNFEPNLEIEVNKLTINENQLCFDSLIGR